MMNTKDKLKVELCLQGAQVHLNNRYNIYRDGLRKNTCDRPRSATNNNSSRNKVTETHRRPFSAGTKPQSSKFRQFLRHATKADLDDLHWTHGRKITETLFPTTLTFNNKKRVTRAPSHCVIYDDISEQSSEDTFASLGTKIRARARTEHTINGAYSNRTKNNLASAEIPRFVNWEKSDYNLKKYISNYNRRITMEEKIQSDDSLNGSDCKGGQTARYGDNSSNIHTPSNSMQTDNVDKFTINESTRPGRDDTLAGRVSFGQHQSYDETDLRNLEPLAKRNYLNLQQLSLVEEESMIELDSLSSCESLKPASGRSHDDEIRKSSIEALKAKQEPSNSHSNSRKESGTFILETSDFTKLWRNHESSLDINKPSYVQYKCDNPQDFPTANDKPDSNHTQSEIEETQTSDESKHFPTNLKSTISDVRGPETYSSEKVETLLDFGHTPRGTHSLPFSKTQQEFLPVLHQKPEVVHHSSLEYISLRNETDTESSMNYIKRQSSWNMSNRDVFEANRQGHENNNKLLFCEDKDVSNEGEESHTGHDNEGSGPRYMNNIPTKAYTARVIEDYKKEIDAINNLHKLTLKDLELASVSPAAVGATTHTSDSKISFDINSTTFNNISEQLTASVGRLDICNIPTEQLIQNYFDAKEDDGSKKIRANYKNAIRKKSAGRNSNTGALNMSDADVKVCNLSAVNTNNSLKSRKTCHSAPNLKCIEAKTKHRTHPLSARIECVQNDKDIESWISTQTITPRIETHSDINKTRNSSSNDIKNSNVNIENGLDSKSNETVAHMNRTECNNTNTSKDSDIASVKVKELSENSTVLDIYSMLKEIEKYGDKPINYNEGESAVQAETSQEEHNHQQPQDNFQEIFTFLEKVEDSANEALSAVSPSAPITVPKLESLLRLSHTELAQRVITAALQLEERSCCITLLQESLATHKEQTLARVTTLEKQSSRNISKVKQDCEEAIKRHQGFIDQLINDKKTLNHRIEQLVDERRLLEERARRQAHTLEERFKVELRTQHDKMAAAQQLARQRWVKQKADKIKELTVKGLEGELRDMAEQQQREVASLRLLHAEDVGRLQAQHEDQLRQTRETLQHENECALIKERQICSTRLEKQILEIELTYQEQRTRLVSEMRAENEQAASQASQRDAQARQEIEKLRAEQEKELSERHAQLEAEMTEQKMQISEELERQREKLEEEFVEYKRCVEAEHQVLLKKRVHEVALQHKQERDRQIEKAIDSMELEAQKGRKELQDALRRNKEQYECELREVAETERATLQRHRDAQARAREAEDKCGNLEITISQLESKLRVAEENIVQCQQRLLDMQKLTEAKWRGKYDELRADTDSMRTSHEQQMQQLYAKVKVAVARKDTAISALMRDNTKALEKTALLEQRLQQQRKDFLRQK